MISNFEIWKPVKGYEGLYEVNNWGEVRSLPRNTTKGGILKNCPHTDGYLQVNLYKEGKVRMHKVHRLVAQAFIPNPNNLPQVNHKDEDKTNNREKNLEWCDCSYNNNYGTRNKRSSISISKANSIHVAQYTKEDTLIAIYYSGREAAIRTGIHQGNITECCKGKRKSCGGYIWRYA